MRDLSAIKRRKPSSQAKATILFSVPTSLSPYILKVAKKIKSFLILDINFYQPIFVNRRHLLLKEVIQGIKAFSLNESNENYLLIISFWFLFSKFNFFRLDSLKLWIAHEFTIVSYLANVVRHFDSPTSNNLHWPSRLTEMMFRPFSTGHPLFTPDKEIWILSQKNTCSSQKSVNLPLVWPVRVTGDEPSSADHIFKRRSAPPDNTTRPDGKNLQKCTSPICPSSTRYCFEW